VLVSRISYQWSPWPHNPATTRASRTQGTPAPPASAIVGGEPFGSKSTRNGSTADYRTALLARDYPEIVERMKAGEFESIAKAEREAGDIM
jgi:hypothetical protein